MGEGNSGKNNTYIIAEIKSTIGSG